MDKSKLIIDIIKVMCRNESLIDQKVIKDYVLKVNSCDIRYAYYLMEDIVKFDDIELAHFFADKMWFMKNNFYHIQLLEELNDDLKKLKTYRYLMKYIDMYENVFNKRRSEKFYEVMCDYRTMMK